MRYLLLSRYSRWKVFIAGPHTILHSNTTVPAAFVIDAIRDIYEVCGCFVLHVQLIELLSRPSSFIVSLYSCFPILVAKGLS